jgi:hypothetical protein
VPKTQWMQDELRLRTRMIGAGVWLSVVLLVGVGAWIAATWSHPHRGGLVAMAAAAASATAIIAVLPRERIVASRFREAYFLGWSLALIIFISVAAGLDTGVRSPMVLTLFLTLVYAALSYPRWSVTVVSAASLVAVLALSELGTTHGALPTSPVYLIGLMTTLAVTGVMCICQARIQEQIRSELGRLSRSDPLTGCLNRLGFTERMATELARARLSPVALVVIDFDGFKAVNDRHGHSAGDDLPTRWLGSAATSSPRCCPTPTRPAPSRWRSGCGWRCHRASRPASGSPQATPTVWTPTGCTAAPTNICTSASAAVLTPPPPATRPSTFRSPSGRGRGPWAAGWSGSTRRLSKGGELSCRLTGRSAAPGTSCRFGRATAE